MGFSYKSLRTKKFPVYGKAYIIDSKGSSWKSQRMNDLQVVVTDNLQQSRRERIAEILPPVGRQDDGALKKVRFLP